MSILIGPRLVNPEAMPRALDDQEFFRSARLATGSCSRGWGSAESAGAAPVLDDTSTSMTLYMRPRIRYWYCLSGIVEIGARQGGHEAKGVSKRGLRTAWSAMLRSSRDDDHVAGTRDLHSWLCNSHSAVRIADPVREEIP